MNGKESARLMLRAGELRELAATLHNERYRTLLLECADNFESLAKRVLEPHNTN